MERKGRGEEGERGGREGSVPLFHIVEVATLTTANEIATMC